MPSYIVEAFLLGLSTGTVCLAYCAPVLVPLVMSEERFHLARESLRLGIFLGGRLLGYLAIGLLVGVLSQAVRETAHSHLFAIVTFIMGLILVIFGFIKNFPGFKWCQAFPLKGSSSWWVFLLGLLTGLNICPPFLAAITGAAGLSGTSAALFYFTAFFFGTALYVPPLLLLGPLSTRPAVQTVARICLLLSGGWFILKAVMIWLA